MSHNSVRAGPAAEPPPGARRQAAVTGVGSAPGGAAPFGVTHLLRVAGRDVS